MYGLQLLFSCSYYIYYSIYHQEEINYRDIHTHTLVTFITVGPYRNKVNTVYAENFAERLKENQVF